MGIPATIYPHNAHYHAIEQAQAAQPLLAIREPVIFIRDHRMVEDPFTMGEVDAVLANVDLAFSFIPSDHKFIVTTN